MLPCWYLLLIYYSYNSNGLRSVVVILSLIAFFHKKKWFGMWPELFKSQIVLTQEKKEKY